MRNINLLLLLLPLLAVFASCISRQYPVTSTYQETAYRSENVSETYTENETTVETLSGQYELDSILFMVLAKYRFFRPNQRLVYSLRHSANTTLRQYQVKVSIWKQLQYEPATIQCARYDTRRASLNTCSPTAGDTGKGQVKWTWITSTPSGITATFSSGSSTDSGSAGSTGVIIGGASDSWVDTANTQINQALFLGGRTYLWSKQADPQIIETECRQGPKRSA